MGGGILKNAPNSLIWAVTLAFLGVLASFVILAINGADTADLWMFVGRITNIVGAVFSGGAVIVAGAAYKSARSVEERKDTTDVQAETIEQHQSESTMLRRQNTELRSLLAIERGKNKGEDKRPNG
jgi:cell shape-determining protein MreC